MKSMSKSELADRAGVTVQTLMNWCRRFDGNPPYERTPDFTGCSANMNFEKIYLIVFRATWLVSSDFFFLLLTRCIITRDH